MRIDFLTIVLLSTALISGCQTVAPSNVHEQTDVDRHAALLKEIATIERAHIKWLENPDTQTPEQRARYVVHLETRLIQRLTELHELEHTMKQKKANNRLLTYFK